MFFKTILIFSIAFHSSVNFYGHIAAISDLGIQVLHSFRLLTFYLEVTVLNRVHLQERGL